MLNIPLGYVTSGMVLAKAIYSSRGDLLLNQGVQIQPFMIDYLQNSGFSSVYVRDKETEDIEVRETISGRVHGQATAAVGRIFDTIEAAAGDVPRKLEDIEAAVHDGAFKQRVLASPEFNELPGLAEEVVGEAMEVELLSGLGTLKSHDNYTFGHCVDVAVCSVVIGKQLRFSKEQLKLLAQGAMLHDIGKVFIGHDVLNKPAKLEPDEFEIMKHHPTLGFEMIREALNIDLMPKHVALQHHERQDGSGYPRGVKGTNRIIKDAFERDSNIALIGEIAAIADVYDALTSDRPYRKGLPPDEVAGIIASMAGTHLNAEIVNRFLTVLPAYPVGLNVRIISGPYQAYRGVVTETKPWNLARPNVRLLSDATGKRISPIELDLERNDTPITSVDTIAAAA